MYLLFAASALAAPPALNLIPFGVGVYAHDRPLRGVMYSVTQVLGYSALAYGSVLADHAVDVGDDAGYYRYETVSALGATMGFGSWIVSAIDGGRLHELEGAAKAARLRAWDGQLATARGDTHD